MAQSRSVLVGDIGGTKVLLGIAHRRESLLAVVRKKRYASAEYPGLVEVARDFLEDDAAELAAGCFGIPGRVRARRAEGTNLAWTVDAEELERALGLPKVTLVNDFEASALGTTILPEDDLPVIQTGEEDPGGNRAVIGAGTGLGEAPKSAALRREIEKVDPPPKSQGGPRGHDGG